MRNWTLGVAATLIIAGFGVTHYHDEGVWTEYKDTTGRLAWAANCPFTRDLYARYSRDGMITVWEMNQMEKAAEQGLLDHGRQEAEQYFRPGK